VRRSGWPASHVAVDRIMDLYTRLLLGVTAFAVLAYISFVYGSCAGDPDCHFRVCGHRFCGVVYSHAENHAAP
jgi:hypothetical protein